MKALFTDFLNWMNEINSTNPMQLETDHEDIALMYIDSGRADALISGKIADMRNQLISAVDKLIKNCEEGKTVYADYCIYIGVHNANNYELLQIDSDEFVDKIISNFSA